MTLADHVVALWFDPERRARAIVAFWWASVLMMGFGYAVIAHHYFTRGLPFP